MTSRKRNLSIIGLVVVLLAASLYVIFTKPTVLGLDLRGGVELVYEGRPTPQVPEVTAQAIDDAIETIRKRTDALGVSEPEIQRAGETQISIGLPNVENADRAIAQVGTTAQLQFYDWEPNVRGDRGPDAPYAGRTSLYEAVEVAAGQQPRAEETDLPPGGAEEAIVERFDGDERQIQRYYDRRNDTHQGRYYLFGPDQQLIVGPDASCEELLSDYEGVEGGPQRTEKDVPKGSECRAELLQIPVGTDDQASNQSTATPRSGPPAGSEVLKVPRGIVVIEAARAPNQPDDVRNYFVLEDDSELSGADIKNPEQNTDPRTNEPIVTMEFTDDGRASFAAVTQRIAQRGADIIAPPGTDPEQTLQRFAITLDDEVVSLATIDWRENPEGIDGRTGAQINGIGSLTETQDLAESLRIGALPIELRLVSQTQVSATLGQQALDQGLVAGLAGLALTLLFLITFYRVLGLVAAVALIMYAIFLFALVKLIPITLTLPGIAGLILTLGVAADANIVIFERIKEEARAGASIRASITTGYQKAMRTIVDANVVTIGVAFILFTLATSGVKGFAFTMGIGTLVSLFTAVLATSAILGSLSNTRLIRSRHALGVRGDSEGPRWNINFVGKSKVFFSGSGLILVIGALAIAGLGLQFGIDFESGTRIKTPVAQQASVDDVRNALAPLGYGDAKIQEVDEPELGDTVFQISTPTLTDAEVTEVREALNDDFGVQRADFSVNSIGPTFGAQVARTAVIAVIASLLLISIYMALRFERKFVVPVLIAIAHDLLIVAGIYSLVGRELTASTVAALLTIMGYSLYDTIIVFDRIRENVPRMPRATFSQIVNRSMSEVLTRSLATSVSTLFPVAALMFFGGETLQDFAFALLVGVASGAYSSIFIAAPILTLWKEREPMYVRRRKIMMEENGGVVPPFASGTIGVDDDGGDGGGQPARRKPARRTPLPTPATAGGAVPAPPAPEGGNGSDAAASADAAAAERKAQRARNRARKKHGRN
ncbi:MAG: protein translocase subunit SecD [Solirubrobacterales bacterium]|nr:protein translocase subunit SecD [Solirubrobacterales bacterium]